MRIGIVCYPTVGGSGAVAAELGKQLARRGHDIHVISYRLPFRLRRLPAEHLLPRGRRLELPAVRVPAARPGAGGQDGGGRRASTASSCSTSTTRSRTRSPASWPSRCWAQARAAHGDDAARHRHHDRGPGPLVLRDHALRHRALGRGHRGLRVPAAHDAGGVPGQRADRRDPQLRRPRPVPDHGARDRSALRRRPARRCCCTSRTSVPSSACSTWCASSSASAREVDAVLLMVGEGPERSSAQALARRLGLSDRTRFLGTQQAIEEIVGLADVFLLPSELESFGLSALEAMALRRAGGRLRRRRAARGRAPRRERLPAAGGRRRRHGRAHDRDPARRRAPARDGRGRPPRACSRCSTPSAWSASTRPSTRGCWGPELDAFDLAAVCAHPDDAELVMGGTLAREAARGRRVCLIDLTRGESGSRGTPETRAPGSGRGRPHPGCVAPRVAGPARRAAAGRARAQRRRGRGAAPPAAAGGAAAALAAAPPRPRRGQPHRLRRLLPGRAQELPPRPGPGLPSRQARSTRSR